ncbi:MAG: class I SAM-dependent methyltransferase [Wenzhouxiangellaceae bacterium]
MNHSHIKSLLAATSCALMLSASALAQPVTDGVDNDPRPSGWDLTQKIEAATYGSHRSPENRARDQYRHPIGTLSFFGLTDDMTVLEIWPGSGWYTEILAPVLRKNGKLIIASYDPNLPNQPDYRYQLHKELMGKFAGNPQVYDQVKAIAWSDPQTQSLNAAGQVDMILTFRSIHGWINDGVAKAVFEDFSEVLKPGGRLGIVQHRAPAGSDPRSSAEMGYVPEATVVELAKAAGFSLVSKSEVNANPADDHDHPEGVWTLPPSLRLGDRNREEYLRIGESDRMTLLFVKGEVTDGWDLTLLDRPGTDAVMAP